jgi:8-oxo-dGTP pyrophosphatase MutT (NUDIX family)
LRDEPTVLLTQRTHRLSSHSGQVAFPGGKADASDADVIATALREAHEEVGLYPANVEVLGALPHYRTGSGFIVTPVFGLVAAQPRWQANPDEVAHVFEVPLQFLMDPANHRRHQMEWEGGVREWYSMPYQDGPQEWFIWGATAGMLRNLYRFLSA